MADATNIDRTFIAEQLDIIISKQREQDREHNDLRTVLLGLVDQVRRLDRKVGEIVPDMEILLKTEIMGRFARYDGQVDDKMEALVTRMMGLFEPKKSDT